MPNDFITDDFNRPFPGANEKYMSAVQNNSSEFSEIPIGKVAVGTCSICGGPVCVHSPWYSVAPDTPTCARCGAIKDTSPDYGPVIPMIPVAPMSPQLPKDDSAIPQYWREWKIDCAVKNF